MAPSRVGDSWPRLMAVTLARCKTRQRTKSGLSARFTLLFQQTIPWPPKLFGPASKPARAANWSAQRCTGWWPMRQGCGRWCVRLAKTASRPSRFTGMAGPGRPTNATEWSIAFCAASRVSGSATTQMLGRFQPLGQHGQRERQHQIHGRDRQVGLPVARIGPGHGACRQGQLGQANG